MSHPCHRSNPLKRSGTDRQQRSLAALAPAHFAVDERTMADFILFARRYAANLKFYGSGVSADASWQPFFEQDISVNLAELASLPLQTFIRFKDDLVRFLQTPGGAPENTQIQYYALYLQLPLILLNDLGQSVGRISSKEPLVSQLNHWAGRELGSDIPLLLSYVLGAQTAPVSGFSVVPVNLGVLNTDPAGASSLPLVPEVVTERLDSIAWPALAQQVYARFESLNDAALTAVTANPAPYQNATSVSGQLEDATRYNLLTGAIERLLSAVQVVITLANEALAASLNRADHNPHYALWLTFLKLYEHPQRLLNEFTQRHLDFYYRQVLQVSPNPEQPDQVALIVRIAKSQSELLLKAGTQFDGGKDDSKTPIIFASDEDVVLNQADIAQLKGLFIEQQGANSTPFAAVNAATADGVDKELDKDVPVWPAFGPAHANSIANIGFSIADDRLRMTDGDRTVVFTVNVSGTMPHQVNNVFAASLTGDEDWVTVSGSQLSVSKSGAKLVFTIELDGSQPAIADYSSELHGEGYQVTTPVLKIWLKPGTGRFNDWVAVGISSTSLKVEVKDSRTYSLSSSRGSIDPGKPFMPFGAQPKANDQFIIGGRELFAKPLASLTLRPKWQEALEMESHYSFAANPFMTRTTVSFLQAGKWQSIDNDLLPFFVHSANSQAVGQFFSYLIWLFSWLGTNWQEVLYNDDGFAGYLAEAFLGQGLKLEGLNTQAEYQKLTEQRKQTSSEGFVRISLSDEFGHHEYPQQNALAVMAKAPTINLVKTAGVNYADDLPLAPYTPVISDLTIDYLTKDSAPQQFLHNYPFGVASATGDSLLPPLTNQGELYIGLKDARPPQSVSLLFAAVEGSANPLKPIATLRWDYLVGDNWVEIPATQISDSSASLSGSGIIRFELPRDADTHHGILPGGYHWLRMSVAKDADAVADLTAIYSQALAATRIANNNDASALQRPLAAETISKLFIADTRIKKITQPRASWQGKAPEGEDDYYQRVSERLRHKRRACAVWDYEHLVLQNFPQVYKVRCLNHTALCRDANNIVVAENGLHPGAVLVVPIPVIDPDSASEPRRPYNTTQTLAKIDSYLRQRISPFVKLEVQNPNIEEIQLAFDVAFTDDIVDSGFYLQLLNQEINQFLMPWAYAGAAQVDFGGKWYKSSLVNFIDERPFVDYISNVRMFHRTDINSDSLSWQNVDHSVVRASSARSILVSHEQHDIHQIGEVNA